jgi:hypothetical protein
VLDKNMLQYNFLKHANGRLVYCHKDLFDSLIFIGGLDQNLVLYNQRSKAIEELPLRHVTRIISKPSQVFFVAGDGFYYWDRKLKSIAQVNGIPVKFNESTAMLNDTTIIFDSKYTYFFNSGKVKKGIFFNDYEYKGALHSLKADNGCGVFGQKDTLFYVYEGFVKKLELPCNAVGCTKIIDQKYWQSDNEFIYSFDPKSNLFKKYSYRLPHVNSYATEFEVDSKYIWIKRQGQVMLISLADNRQFEFQIKPEEGHIETIFDDCNVYSIYENKVVFCSKEDFLKKCELFDAEKFDLDIMQFDLVVDSIGVYNDSIPSSSLEKLNYLKKRYSSVENIEILKKLDNMNTGAFIRNHYKFPDGFISCYKDKSMPIAQRNYCINYLADEYGKLSNFSKIIHLKYEYTKYFDEAVINRDCPFRIVLDSVETYLAKIDSLQATQLTNDSLYYFSSLALETICKTRWYCHEGCGGCSFSLVTDRLKSFKAKYPESDLVDNSEIYLINIKHLYDYEVDESRIAQNMAYESFLIKYPDSDLKTEVKFSIFQNWANMEQVNPIKIKTTAERFIRESGSDNRITAVKQRLEYLNVK